MQQRERLHRARRGAKRTVQRQRRPDRRTECVDAADAVDERANPTGVGPAQPLGVQQQPDGEHGVAVDVVEEDRESARIESDEQRVAHLLARRQRDVSQHAVVVVERIATVFVVEGRTADGAVERDRTGREFVERPRAPLLEDEVQDRVRGRRWCAHGTRTIAKPAADGKHPGTPSGIPERAGNGSGAAVVPARNGLPSPRPPATSPHAVRRRRIVLPCSPPVLQ